MKKIVILCIAAVSFAGCTGKKGVTAVAEDKGVLTKSAVAEEASVQLTEVFTSEIEPYKENDITPAASGVHIDRIYVEVGDPVREGQLVVTLDPTQYTQQLVQLKTVEDDYNRLLPVYEAGGISTQQIEQAKAQLDVQREVVANLKKNIEVRSPISGVVTARNYESGDLFAQQPILHIMQIDPLKVVANISEQYFPNVKVGMPVKLAVDIFPDEEFTGTVSLIYPALDPTTRTFKVEVKVPNAKRTLRPGDLRHGQQGGRDGSRRGRAEAGRLGRALPLRHRRRLGCRAPLGQGGTPGRRPRGHPLGDRSGRAGGRHGVVETFRRGQSGY